MERRKERERDSSSGLFPKCSQPLGLGWIFSLEVGTQSSSPMWVAMIPPLESSLLLPKAYIEREPEAESEPGVESKYSDVGVLNSWLN